MSFEITIDPAILKRLDAATATLENCEPIIGQAAQRTVADHLAKKNRRGPHRSAARLGATPTGTYGEMAQSVSFTYSPNRVTVAIHHPAAAMRYYGTPKEGLRPGPGKKYLTIPAQAKAYGRSLDDFSGSPLRWLYGRNGLYAVALASEPRSPLFYLKTSVRQDPDPSILPPEADFDRTITQTLTDALDLEN